MSTEEVVQKVVTHLEKSLMNDIRSDVKKEIRAVIQSEFEELHKKIDNRFNSLGNTMDLWKNDFDEDREKLRSISTNTGNIRTELTEVGSTVDKLPKKLENTVKDTLPEIANEAIPKAVNDTFEVFGKKVRVVERPRSFLKKLRFWK